MENKRQLTDDDFNDILSGMQLFSITEDEEEDPGLSGSSTVTIKYGKEGCEEELHLFFKRLPDLPYLRDVITSIRSFERESLVYRKFLTKFEDYVEGQAFAKCYLAKDDLIVLENLTKKGYRPEERTTYLNLLECERAVESIAKLHAASLVYEIDNKKKIIDEVPLLKRPPVLSLETEFDRNFFYASVRALKDVANVYFKAVPKEVKDKAFDFMYMMPSKLGMVDNAVNVLSHGDIWSKNIMFRYDRMNDLSGSCLIDFQYAHYTLPAFDPLMLLCNCTSSLFRAAHMEYVLTYYFSRLSFELAPHNLHLESILPRDTFMDSAEDILPLHLALAPIAIHYSILPPNILASLESVEDFTIFMEKERAEKVLEGMNSSQVYKERMLDCLTALFNYFKSH